VPEQRPDPAQGPPLVHGRPHAVDQRALAVRLAQPLHRERPAPLAPQRVAPAVDRGLDPHRRRPEHPEHVPGRVHARLPQPVPRARRRRRREHQALALARRRHRRPAQPAQPARQQLEPRGLGLREPEHPLAPRRHLQPHPLHRAAPPGPGQEQIVIRGQHHARVPVLPAPEAHEVHAGPEPPPRRRRVGLGLPERRLEEHVHRLRQRVQPQPVGLAPGHRHAPRHEVHEDQPLDHPQVLHAHEHLIRQHQVGPPGRQERPRPVHHAHRRLAPRPRQQRREPRPGVVAELQAHHRRPRRQRDGPVPARLVPVQPRAALERRAPVPHPHPRPVDELGHRQRVVRVLHPGAGHAHPLRHGDLDHRRRPVRQHQVGVLLRAREERALRRDRHGGRRARRVPRARRLELRPLRRALALAAPRRPRAPLEVVHGLRHEHHDVRVPGEVQAPPGPRVKGRGRVVHRAPERLERQVLVREPPVERPRQLRLDPLQDRRASQLRVRVRAPPGQRVPHLVGHRVQRGQQGHGQVRRARPRRKRRDVRPDAVLAHALGHRHEHEHVRRERPQAPGQLRRGRALVVD
jgi:hypothetical protein